MLPMKGPVRIKRYRRSGGAPMGLRPGEMAINELDGVLFFADGNSSLNGAGQHTAILSIPLKAIAAQFAGTAGAIQSLANGGTGVAAVSTADLLNKLGAQLALSYTPENISNRGAANGYAGLGADGKLPTSVIPSAVLNALEFIGVWDANANNPALTSGAGTKGYIYVVATAGTTSLDGLTSWNVGDWAIYDGTKWRKLDG